MAKWIDSAFTSNTGWKLLNDLVDIDHRLAASPGERRAAELMKKELSELGARNPRIEEFPITGWERNNCELKHVGTNTSYRSFALPRSPSVSATGEVVDLNQGAPEDFEENDIEDKVVIVSSDTPPHYPRVIHRREKYHLAVKNGAVGFIFRNHIDGDLIRSGTVSGSSGPIGEIPAVGVSKETGLRISRRHHGEKIEIDVSANIREATSQNVYSEIGPETDECVVISAHLDGHDISESAKDDAVGIATVVEVAKHLITRENELETRIRFAGFGGEEVGFIGSKYHQKNHSDDIKVILQNDGVARSRDFMVHTNGFNSLETPVNNTSKKYDHPIQISRKTRMTSDHWPFVKQGTPGYLISSVPSDSNMTGYGSSRGIILTSADTIDKLDIRDLRTHSIIETELAIEVAKKESSINKNTPEEIKSRVDDERGSVKYQLY